jgi:hypothetical protein
MPREKKIESTIDTRRPSSNDLKRYIFFEISLFPIRDPSSA